MSRNTELADCGQALAGALLPGHGRREADRDLRHGAEEHREAADRDGARQGRGQPERSRPRCSASTATPCARKSSSCGSRREAGRMNVRRALISVSDKTGSSSSRAALAALGVQILSTGGTAKLLEKEGIARHRGVGAHRLPGNARRPGEDAAPEDPRRHPRAARPAASTWRRSSKAGIAPIDLVVVNLYPFEATVADPDCTLEDAIENIDIGGPAMLRAAAKNHAGVAVVVDPADYARRAGGNPRQPAASPTRRASRWRRRCSRTPPAYDGAIANYLYLARRAAQARRAYPDVLNLQFVKLPGHALRREPAPDGGVLPRRAARSPGGIAALPPAAGQGALLQQHRRRRRGLGVREELRRAGLRHRQARQSLRRRRSRDSPLAAYRKAFKTDPTSAFGGILAFNRALDRADGRGDRQAVRRSDHRAARRARGARVPRRQGRTCACWKCRCRTTSQAHDYKRVGGGLLVQSSDSQVARREGSKVVKTKKQPTRRAAGATCCSPGRWRSS